MKVHRIVGCLALASALLWVFTGITLWVPPQRGVEQLVPFGEAVRGLALIFVHIGGVVWAAYKESFA